MFKDPNLTFLTTQLNLKIVLKAVKIYLRSLKNVFVASFHSFQTN